jgi:DNA-binding NarL/FixJ family response regulator
VPAHVKSAMYPHDDTSEAPCCVGCRFLDRIGLSEQETSVAHLLLRGWTNAGIACHLQLSGDEVEETTARVIGKVVRFRRESDEAQ